jgi:cytochrome c2
VTGTFSRTSLPDGLVPDGDMRATEKTYYSLKRLHGWMAVSSLALLAVTVWALLADHARQWKQYQRTFQDRVQPWMTQARIAEEQGRQSPDEEEIGRLRQLLRRQQPSLGKRLLRLPLIDAFGRAPTDGGSLAIEQIWLPDLTIDYHFRQVARFDRCMTCHQGIDQTEPGRPGTPALRPEEVLSVELAAATLAPQAAGDEAGQKAPPTLEGMYGLVLAEEGIVDPNVVTIQRVLPKTPAANAGLLVGDAILKIDGQEVVDRAAAQTRLLEQVERGGPPTEGRPLRLEIRRGLPQPYSSHPRPDLFLGPMSPHPMSEFGCTICHEGQGSATEFRWASHTPNHPAERERWRRQYGWFENPHWDFPMLSRRFAESRCLKCHHEVTDLEAGRRWPDPPAEKLLAGYQLVRQSGCFGCHEIKGFDESGRSIGPDLRLEPTPQQAARGLPPGTLRKVGPSLREVTGRLAAAFLENWIGDPAGYRPETRMPRFFGLHEHLDGANLAEAKRFEAVEIRAIAEYLLAAGRPVELQAPPPEVTERPSAERGKRLFQTQGCLACHKHRDFPEGQATQGADLSQLGAKYGSPTGAAWLASWIRDPTRHSPRTLMPSPLLAPTPLEGAGGDVPSQVSNPKSEILNPKSEIRMTDPAADVAAYLLEGRGWQPRKPAPLNERDLDELALLHLGKVYGAQLARRYLKEGIGDSAADRVPGDAAELQGEITVEKKLRYVGRQTIAKRGCYGCHDIPGFEDAQPIGPALTDWGRKQASLLAFERINQFIEQSAAQEQLPALAHADSPARKGGVPAGAAPGTPPFRAGLSYQADELFPNNRVTVAGTTAQGDPASQGFFVDALRAHRREGFIWQKLRAPRSFDFKVAAEKGYNEWLTMGRFQLTDQQREAIATFVLGLVAEPPAERYVYRPEARQKAIVEGRKVLEKYACAQCHTLEMERWTFEFDPAKFEDPPTVPDYDFLKPQVSPEEMAKSLKTDNRGLGSTEVAGMPRVDAQGRLLVVDEDQDQQGRAVYQYSFMLWEPAVINGKLWTVGGASPLVCGPEITDGRLAAGRVDVTKWAARLTAIRPPVGGMLARLLYPAVLAEARASGRGPADGEAWGWLPPPLVGEGAKVQPAWLYDFLLAPERIRPSSVLRMPHFNLSPEEAGKLVDYFAAVAGAEFPYSSDARSRSGYLEKLEQTRPPAESTRLDEALKLLTASGTDCVKCHLIGDYRPGSGAGATLAPNLERVGRRIRRQYLRRWLANPKTVLPYTPMTVNFPPVGPPLEPELFGGNATEQLDSVIDLLLNYERYLAGRTSIRQLVPPGSGSRPDGPSIQPTQIRKGDGRGDAGRGGGALGAHDRQGRGG